MKIFSNIAYSIGIACIIALVAFVVYSDRAFTASVNELMSTPPEEWHLLPDYTRNRRNLSRHAVYALGIGVIPMTIACVAVYKLNGIHKSKRKFWKFNLIFIPAYFCAACAFYMVNSVIFSIAFR